MMDNNYFHYIYPYKSSRTRIEKLNSEKKVRKFTRSLIIVCVACVNMRV